MPGRSHHSHASRKCPSCGKSLYYSSRRCTDCGWQAWRSRPEFFWLIAAFVLGVFFVIGLYRQNTDFSTIAQKPHASQGR